MWAFRDFVGFMKPSGWCELWSQQSLSSGLPVLKIYEFIDRYKSPYPVSTHICTIVNRYGRYPEHHGELHSLICRPCAAQLTPPLAIISTDMNNLHCSPRQLHIPRHCFIITAVQPLTRGSAGSAIFASAPTEPSTASTTAPPLALGKNNIPSTSHYADRIEGPYVFSNNKSRSLNYCTKGYVREI